MKKGIYFITVLILLCSCSEKDNIHEPIKTIDGVLPLVIVIGQSNAEGFAPKETAPEWLKINNYELPTYLMWDKNLHIFGHYQLERNVGSEKNSDSRFGFDIFFAKKYIETYKTELFCVKQSLGGIPISEKGAPASARWTSHTDLIPSKERKMVAELVIKLEEAQLYAKNNNVTLVPIAILYMQGESDADANIRLADYKTNFVELTTYLRKVLKNDKLPVINAELMYRNDNYKKVNQIFKQLKSSDPYLRTVNMSNNQTSIGDNLHYDASAFEFMGNKMFEYYKSMKSVPVQKTIYN